MKKLASKYLVIILAASGLSACSTSEMSFADRTELAELRGEESLDSLRYFEYGIIKPTRTLGELTLGKSDLDSSEAATVIGFKRMKSRFYAETSLFQSDNKEKSFFDEGIFNMGVDKKTKGMNVELSFKF